MIYHVLFLGVITVTVFNALLLSELINYKRIFSYINNIIEQKIECLQKNIIILLIR